MVSAYKYGMEGDEIFAIAGDGQKALSCQRGEKQVVVFSGDGGQCNMVSHIPVNTPGNLMDFFESQMFYRYSTPKA